MTDRYMGQFAHGSAVTVSKKLRVFDWIHRLETKRLIMLKMV